MTAVRGGNWSVKSFSIFLSCTQIQISIQALVSVAFNSKSMKPIYQFLIFIHFIYLLFFLLSEQLKKKYSLKC